MFWPFCNSSTCESHVGSTIQSQTVTQCDLHSACQIDGNTPVRYKGGLPGYRLKRVLDFIGEKLEEDISLSQLAAIAGMSPHYFSQLFKQSTGRAPHQFVLLKRIEHAKKQLCDPKSSVTDAALDAGFQSPSHFARVFRQLEGVTPSRFRADYVTRPTRTTSISTR